MNIDNSAYLDHAAATPLDSRVREAMAPYETELFFNPSAPYAPAWEIRHIYEQARADLAHAIGGKPAEVVITAGATESINLAFSVCSTPDRADAHTDSPGNDQADAQAGVLADDHAGTPANALAHARAGSHAEALAHARPGIHANALAHARPGSHADAHVVSTTIEHASVLACVRAHPHTLVGVNHHGLVDPARVRDAIEPSTRLVTIGLANNEIGTVQPMRAIADVVRKVRQQRLMSGNATPLYLHSDASQCPGQIDVNTSTLGVDMLTLNAAKIYGPKQVGLLWAARSVQLSPVLLGGGQERGLRSGTENVAGAVGFARALQLAVENRKDEAKRLATLRDYLQKRILDEFPEAVVSGHKKHRLPGFLHISFPGLDAERLVYLLEESWVYVGTGAACAANKATRSHVLEAIGLPPEVADGSLRLTFGHLSTDQNTVRAADRICRKAHAEYERLGLPRDGRLSLQKTDSHTPLGTEEE